MVISTSEEPLNWNLKKKIKKQAVRFDRTACLILQSKLKFKPVQVLEFRLSDRKLLSVQNTESVPDK